MSSSPTADLPGVGVVYTSGLDDWLRAGRAAVVEVEPQTLWFHAEGADLPLRVAEDELERVASLPGDKLIHGIGFAVGGTVAPDPIQLAPLRRTIEVLRPRWVSEHLSFNAFDDAGEVRLTGFQLPPRQTRDGVRAAVGSIRALSDQLSVPFAVETGVSYLRPRDDEMPDGAFVAEVVNAADCGILLDLHNLWTNQRNGRQNARQFLAQLPLERVWEIHVAGGELRGGFWLDGHCDAIPREVLELLSEVAPRCPALGAVVFELFPTYLARFGAEWVGSQLDAIEGALRRSRAPSAWPPAEAWIAPRGGPDPATWERALGRLVLGHVADDAVERELAADPGLALVRELLGEFRASMFASAMPLSCRLLLLSLGPEAVSALLSRYGRQRSPARFASTEAAGFARWVCDATDLEVRFLSDVVAYELAVIEAATSDRATVVRLEHDPLVLCRALAEGRLPEDARVGRFEVEITP